MHRFTHKIAHKKTCINERYLRLILQGFIASTVRKCHISLFCKFYSELRNSDFLHTTEKNLTNNKWKMKFLK